MSILDLQSMPLLETNEDGQLRPSNRPPDRRGSGLSVALCCPAGASNLSVLANQNIVTLPD